MEHEGRHIPNMLKRHRRLNNYSQLQVAYLLGHKDNYNISNWENGKSTPTFINAIKLSIIYRTLLRELFHDLYLELQHDIVEKEKSLIIHFPNSKPNGEINPSVD